MPPEMSTAQPAVAVPESSQEMSLLFDKIHLHLLQLPADGCNNQSIEGWCIISSLPLPFVLQKSHAYKPGAVPGWLSSTLPLSPRGAFIISSSMQVACSHVSSYI